MQEAMSAAQKMKDKDELIIRQANAEDAMQIAEVEKACFSTPWSYESLKDDITKNDRALYITGQSCGRVCGYVGVWKILDEGHITNVAVLPEYRRQHVASAILAAMFDAMQRQGVMRYTLEVRAGNEAAIALYKGLGFSEAGIRRGYYEDNGEDAIIMWKE